MSQKRCKSGFTLIELLVVISIIALLLSIVLPALRKVKEHARIVLCSSNCKQIGYQMTIYNSNYNDRFPLYTDAYLNNNAKWNDGTYRYWPYFIDPTFERFSSENFPEYFICPSIKRKDEISESNIPYGYNYSILGNYTGSGSAAYAKASSFTNTSGTIMLTESRDYDKYGGTYAIDNDFGSPFIDPPENNSVYQDSRISAVDCPAYLAYRHAAKGEAMTTANAGMVIEPEKYEPGGKASVVWLDLHVTTEKRDELKDPENVGQWGVRYIK